MEVSDPLNKSSRFTNRRKITSVLIISSLISLSFPSSTSGNHDDVSYYYSSLLVEGDQFVWQIDLLKINDKHYQSNDLLEYGISEGSLINLSILKNMSGVEFNHDSYDDYLPAIELQSDDQVTYKSIPGATIGFKISLKTPYGFGFPIMWALNFVDGSTNRSFSEEIQHRLGGSHAYNVEIGDNRVNWTFSSSDQIENSSFDISSGALISYYQSSYEPVFSDQPKVSFELMINLKHFPDYVNATSSEILPKITTEAESSSLWTTDSIPTPEMSNQETGTTNRSITQFQVSTLSFIQLSSWLLMLVTVAIRRRSIQSISELTS